MGPSPFYGARTEKPPFALKANEYMSPSGDIIKNGISNIQSVVHCGKFNMEQNVDVSCSEFR